MYHTGVAPPPPQEPQEFEMRVRTLTVSPEEARRMRTEDRHSRAGLPESMLAINVVLVETDPPPDVRRYRAALHRR
jgi:hypothetical protein